MSTRPSKIKTRRGTQPRYQNAIARIRFNAVVPLEIAQMVPGLLAKSEIPIELREIFLGLLKDGKAMGAVSVLNIEGNPAVWTDVRLDGEESKLLVEADESKRTSLKLPDFTKLDGYHYSTMVREKALRSAILPGTEMSIAYAGEPDLIEEKDPPIVELNIDLAQLLQSDDATSPGRRFARLLESMFMRGWRFRNLPAGQGMPKYKPMWNINTLNDGDWTLTVTARVKGRSVLIDCRIGNALFSWLKVRSL